MDAERKSLYQISLACHYYELPMAIMNVAGQIILLLMRIYILPEMVRCGMRRDLPDYGKGR